MIRDGGRRSLSAFREADYDIFIYGLGYESRSTAIAALIRPQSRIIALKMPEMRVHAYENNLNLATKRNHIVATQFEDFTARTLPRLFDRSDRPLKVCFDVSSVNRVMLVETLTQLARLCRSSDQIDVVYSPAVFQEPDWQFPQIERLGPINYTFSSIEADPNKPLCLLFGAGFEAGVSMGLIHQLEPRISYCFWGSGVDARFDRAVRRANFDFNFGGFNTKPIAYNINDPKGAFLQLESILYGLVRTFRVIIIPLGPKLFTFLATLQGMAYLGEVALWRVQHSRLEPPDSLARDHCIWSQLNSDMLIDFASRDRERMELVRG